ncbi:NAD-dependent glycerol-3-phosphate dehydrogenase [Mesorhizobium sp. L103C119B0]|uniref:NAD(P)H-dependent glycerol-3-phosphate dehydrogenase n=1 Tax=Mesorhizobium sp. L103C119B0 TaxID=1287085 RepID=UPI0003CFFE50|nr:NAD-dependent glycerol-3-phosphate dehydrogenase [Mesorhizobium sp. L103C119B0]ESZ68101.1 NAD-dependent glycerol-3-phosphate dehydrogenase [Mesorhizobium sp. L103C119B0]
MARILILGAGVMGSALAVPAADNGHEVLLVGTHLDSAAIAAMRRPGGVHPKLDAPLPAGVRPIDFGALRPTHFAEAEFVVIGVSSPGIAWAVKQLNEMLQTPKPIAFVTKGLVRDDGKLSTYAQAVPPAVGLMQHFIGIGGPCIARELANRLPTASVYACADEKIATGFARLMQTSYYRLSTTDDAAGVEGCAALKNFFAIGVSAMQTRFTDVQRGGATRNPTAGAFNQAAREMALLCERLGGRRDTAFDLAGIGDLHVTVGGGRNSRLGHALGQGRTVSAAMAAELTGETVEGIDTARALSAWIPAASTGNATQRQGFPLTSAIIDALLDDAPFQFDLL